MKRHCTTGLFLFLSLLLGVGGSLAAPARASAQDDSLPGRWGELRPRPAAKRLSEKQRKEIERLRALGYVSGSRETRGSGVTLHDAAAEGEGYNLYCSGHGPEALLIDMRGRVIHRWRYPFDAVWPDRPEADGASGTEWWRRVHLFENGDLLAIFAGFGLIRIDAGSRLIWAKPIAAHHDLDVAPCGDIYVLTREAHMIPRIDDEEPISEDFITVLDADGNEKRRFSVLEALERSEFAGIWRESAKKRGDIFHTNSIEILRGRAADRAGAFREGNLLVSSRVLDMIAVVDPETERVVWAHTGTYKSQHDPKILQNGDLMLFDNLGPGEEKSRVIEYALPAMTKVWEYEGDRKRPFYSRTCGTAERLPGGNTLITESDNGRAFEVTPEGAVAWEFYNPHRAGDEGRFIACIAEMIRLPADYPLAWARSGDGE